jgi:alpha-L-rhamnosidase
MILIDSPFLIDSGEPKLEKECAEHAIMIYCLKAIAELASLLQVGEEPSYVLGTGSESQPISTLVPKLIEAHNKHYYDRELGVYVSGPEKQISWGSNAWAVIAGVPESKDIAQRALKAAYTRPESVQGLTPYLHHYVRSDRDYEPSLTSKAQPTGFVSRWL